MVAPITGPFTFESQTNKIPGVNAWRRQFWQQGYKQAKPFDLPLAYWVMTTNANSLTDFGGGIPQTSEVNAWMTPAYNRAYSKWKDALAQGSSLALMYAERREALEMMSNRLVSLWRFTRALRKFDFAQASYELGLERGYWKNLNVRREAKRFGSNYLEFHFGWSPLVSDIGAAIDVLQGPVPVGKVVGRGSSRFDERVVNNFNSNHRLTTYKSGNIDVRCEAEVWVSNPNLWLANQLGLVNPALVAWELVPFSFVVDWFVNVGDFLSGFSDTWGLTVTKQSHSYRLGYKKRTVEVYYTNTYTNSWDHDQFRRIPGTLPGPTLAVRPPWVLSPRRGLAAISLLLIQLKG